MRRYQSASQARSPWWERTWAWWAARWRWPTRKRASSSVAMTTTWATTQPGAAAARSCLHRPVRRRGPVAGTGGGAVGAPVLAGRVVAAVAVDVPGTLMGPPSRLTEADTG